MALKFKAKSKEEIPAELQPLYVEREGAFVLDVEGVVDKARVEGGCLHGHIPCSVSSAESVRLRLRNSMFQPVFSRYSRLSGNGQALSPNT
jgi:hypothetical protein